MLKSKSLPILAGAGALLAAGLLAAAPAEADITYQLTSCHISSPGSCSTAGTSYGTVTLTQNGANVDFDVALSGGSVFVETGAADDQLFKFNATGIVVGDIVNETTVPTLTPAVPLNGFTGAFNGDGTGNFSFGIACVTASQCNGASGANFSELTFTVNGATIAEVTPANTDPKNVNTIFVADILCGATSGCSGTGPVDVSVPTPLIGHGLLALLAVGGVLFGGRLLESLKKHQTQAA